ncbi:MAG: hypothetical protein WCW53_10380, partial [Syntrophales bacterium]
HLKGFDDDLWQQVRLKVRKGERKDIPGRIIATDISLDAVRAAGVNAGRAKMGRYIQFRQCPFEETSMPGGKGVVVMNPPYGQRLGEEADLAGLYAGIGDFFKEKCEGYRGYVFTANLDLAKKVGLRTSRRVILYNGELESRLLEYEIYEGSRKQPPKEEKRRSGDGEHPAASDYVPGADQAIGRGYAKIAGVTGDSFVSVPTAPIKTRNNKIIKGPENINRQRFGKTSRERNREPGRILSRRIIDQEETSPGLKSIPNEIPARVEDIVDADAIPYGVAVPERRAPVRRRVIPKK